MTSKITPILFLSNALALCAAVELDDSYMLLETRLEPISAVQLLLVILIALILLAGVIWWILWLRRKRAERLAIPPTPYEVATTALQALLSEGLPERGESKQFHQRLSGILRQYLEERFGVSAPRLTTEEFLMYLAETPEMVKEHRLLLQTFLTACDMVKFAGVNSMPADMQELAKSCRTFLDNTRENPENMQEASK